MSTAYRTTRPITVPALRDRILVDGVDVTVLRGSRTVRPGYNLVAPFGYGQSRPLVFPQYNPLQEPIPAWARKGAIVLYQTVDADGNVVPAEDGDLANYRGVVTSVGITGPVLSLELSGDLIARAELLERQPFAFRAVRDIGGFMFDAVRDIGGGHQLIPRVAPGGADVGPTTGIELLATGGMTMLGYLQHLVTQSQTADGDQRTLMPTRWGGTEWDFELKDRSTVDYTIFLDDARIVADLNDDASESPNVFYGSCVTPEGAIERGARYPGLVQGTPPPFPTGAGASFGLGTTDNDLGGDGITVMVNRLVDMGYMDREDYNSTFDAEIERAVNRFRRDAHLGATGLMDANAWDKLFDLSVTGPSIQGAKIFPIVEADEVRTHDYTATGALAGVNPDHDPSVLRVEIGKDFGNLTRKRMADWFRGRLALSQNTDNWAGTIKIADGVGIFAGEWQAGDTPGPEHLVRGTEIRPGRNAWLPFPGILVHISEVGVDGDVTLSVDCRARDWLELREVLERRRESRRDPRREWRRENRRGQSIHDAKNIWDRWGGVLSNPLECLGDEWTVTPVIVGQIGTVSELLLQATPAAEFVVAFFCAAPGGGDLDQKCQRLKAALDNLFPNPWPVNDAGETAWETDHQDWLRRMLFKFAAGDEEEPCGYGNRRHTDRAGNTTDAPLTGEHRDTASFEYASGREPVIYMAILPKTDTVIQPGRVLKKREEDSA